MKRLEAINGFWSYRAKFEPKVKIRLPYEIFLKMLSYAQASKGEISGFCKNKVIKTENEIKVDVVDIKIFTQEVTDSRTTLTTDEMTAHYLDLIRRDENPEEWNLWWHSHSDGTVFFSHIDVPTIEQVGKNKALFSICINTRGEMTARYDRKGKFVAEAAIIIDYPLNANIVAACKKEVAEKVTYIRPVFTRIIPTVDTNDLPANYLHPTRRHYPADITD